MFIDYYQKIFKNNHYAYDICEWLLQFYPGLKSMVSTFEVNVPFLCPLKPRGP